MSVISVKKKNLNQLGFSDFKDWIKHENHIYIGRNMNFYVPGTFKSKWANPFTVKKYGLEECLVLYEKHVRNNLMNDLKELKGKTLGCWCREVGNKKKRICHGDILLELIKEVESETKTVESEIKEVKTVETVESETKTVEVESETKTVESETKTNKLLKLINESKNNKLIRKIKKCSITENEKYVIIDTSALSNDELIKSFLENIISKTKENIIKIKKRNLV